MKIPYALLVTLAWMAAAPQTAIAQSGVSRDTIVVTATRSEIPLADAIVPITVIDRQRIELSMATDLAELLRFEAGIDIGRNGGPGQATSVFLRGTESNHTLVLVDGVRINPGTIGGAAVQHLDPQVIERVEIVKGTRSALYGTDAIGGVINIITRRTDTPYLELGAGGGSDKQRSGFLSGGAHSRHGEFGMTLNVHATDGYAISEGSSLERGYGNVSGSLYGSREFGFGELTLRHWRASGNVEYLDFFLTPLDQDFLNETSALELANRVGDALSSKLVLSHSRDRIEQNQSAGRVESTRLTADWQLSAAAGNHLLSLGLFASDEEAESLSSFGGGFSEPTGYRAIFLQDSLRTGAHRAFVAARYSDYDSFGSKLTWNAEYGVDVGERWTLSAGAGHAFRAPDATDRFGFGGNPNLRPEIADELQLGASYRLSDRQTLRLELYANDIENLIEFDLSDFTLRNIAEAEIRGAELGYRYTADRFELRATALLQRADNAADDARLLRRAEESLSVSYTQSIGEHRMGLSVLVSGDRADFDTTLDGYTLVNLTGEFRISDRWRLNARIENLFDEDYETAAGFRMQSLSAFAELRYRH